MSSTARSKVCPDLLAKQARDMQLSAELRRLVDYEMMNRNFDPDFAAQGYIFDLAFNLDERVRRERK
jgi:hypothetical protein